MKALNETVRHKLVARVMFDNDYRYLLWKYLNHVGSCGGATFLSQQYHPESHFTPAELQFMGELEKAEPPDWSKVVNSKKEWLDLGSVLKAMYVVSALASLFGRFLFHR